LLKIFNYGNIEIVEIIKVLEFNFKIRKTIISELVAKNWKLKYQRKDDPAIYSHEPFNKFLFKRILFCKGYYYSYFWQKKFFCR